MGLAPHSIRIGIIGDQTGTSDLDASYAILQRGVQRLSSENVALVLHTGDLVESSVDAATYRQMFGRATTILDRLPVPWYLTPGDHDVNPPPPFIQDSGDRSREELFRELYGLRRPQIKDHLYYSFDTGDYHFIALYSHEVLNADPRWGTILLADLSDAQRRWLTADLEAHANVRGIVVFLHQPLWYNWSAWRDVHELLRRYPVAAVIAGHFHYNQDEGLLDGIRYVTVGATGGSTKTGSPRAGSLQHVTVLTLRGRSSEFRLLPVDMSAPLEMTARRDMDRVQMLDLILGNLWDFGMTNPVFRKGNTLVGACDASEPARLKLLPIGNPLDVPLDVSVRVDSPGVQLQNAQFAAGVCISAVGGEKCQLARGSRVTTANLSTVGTTWGCAAACAPPAPLWSATPILTDLSAAAQTVGLNVRLSFGGAGSELFLERDVSTKIMPCP
jgi:hypothetical protein